MGENSVTPRLPASRGTREQSSFGIRRGADRGQAHSYNPSPSRASSNRLGDSTIALMGESKEYYQDGEE